MTPSKSWQVFKRYHGKTLLEHLCRIRQIDFKQLLPDYNLHLHNPNLLPGMAEARRLMRQAIKQRWPVAIFGDYDADGTPGAVLLTLLCQQLGLRVTVFLPTRETGYGIGATDDAKKIAKVAKLLITVDTGITAVAPVAELKKNGISTIIIDHHLPPKDVLPDTAAIIDPYLEESKYPFKNLCGCALAFKFIQALQRDFPDKISDGFLKWQLDLVAVSTVADMVPLRGENRALVHFGLQVLKKTRRPGLTSLMRQAGINPVELTAGRIGYTIGPRLNSAGRLGDNRPAYDLLITTDSVIADQLALTIEAANRARQALVEKVLNEASNKLFEQNLRSDLLYIVEDKSWPVGVVGLVAGRLVEFFGRPVIVGSRLGETIRASARSIAAYPVIDGLVAVSRHLVQFGGHRQAAGLTAREENWEVFISELKNHAEQYLGGILPKPSLQADDFLTLNEATLRQAQKLSTLEPHGLGNPRPIFIIRDVELKDAQPIGQTKKHLRVTLTKDSQRLPAIGFSLAEKFASYESNRADVAGHLTENIWNGNSNVQFQLIDFKAVENDIEENEYET